MLPRTIRRQVARLVAKFTRTELRDARAEAARCEQEFRTINLEIASINKEFGVHVSDQCTVVLLRKLAMNFSASSRVLERWASAIDKAIALKAEER
jgi:hypothetical protein